jgi:hypothetical protein
MSRPMSSVNNTPRSQLIVVLHPSAEPRGLEELARAAGVTPRPLFGESPERLRYEARRLRSSRKVRVPDLSVYYSIDTEEERFAELVPSLLRLPAVDGAYVKMPADAPCLPEADVCTALPGTPPVTTPDLSGKQKYLGAAPAGINATYARTRPGGAGLGVRIIDVEREWRFTHEDLLTNWGGVIGGFPANILRERNHGTAILGLLGGDTNSFGIKGICPDTTVSGISTRTFGMSPTAIPGTIETSAAIHQAALTLSPGDIILLELQREGPPFVCNSKQIAVEWWPDDFDAIVYATVGREILVVEAAGNGFVNLDDAVYDTPAPTFGSSWKNPFNRANRDSGAILVGAGAPPSGVDPDRSRLDFSNFGGSVDVQGWGRKVVTTGYGCLQGGANEDRWYMDQFGGTSSASAMIAGVLACVQGYRLAAGKPLLTPSEARNLLRTTGSPQTDAQSRPATQRVGPRPNLKDLIPPPKKRHRPGVKRPRKGPNRRPHGHGH